MSWRFGQQILYATMVASMSLTGLVPVANGETVTRSREEIAGKYKWELSAIYPNWEAWEAATQEFKAKIEAFKELQGTIGQGPAHLLKAYKLSDELGMMAYLVYRYPTLQFDLNQKDTSLRARTQDVHALFAALSQAQSWFAPEHLAIPLETVQQWMAENPELEVYRFAIENLYRQQEHVLDEKGEQILAFSDQFRSSPSDIYAALSIADISFPDATLSSGEEVRMTPAQYRSILLTNRNQSDRAIAFDAHYSTYKENINTYAAIYNSILHRDWAQARVRNYESTLVASLHENNIPTSVVENLIATTRAGTGPLQRYHRLRKRVLGLEDYHMYDSGVPLVDLDKTYDYDDAVQWVMASVKPLGKDYQKTLRTGFEGSWVDVYETEGKRSGAYSAGVYGVHPFMLMNYNATLNDVFTLAHEMGHTMHTILSHETQPFVYSSPTLFVAEVASTMNEALLLEYMLSRTNDPKERILLLTTAIDNIKNTFYGQVMFAAYELEAHKLVEQGKPITADILGDIYFGLLQETFGDSLTLDELYRVTWSRIPHFYRTPYYVYQYATCFASSAKLFKAITEGSRSSRKAAVERYLTLLSSGGNDYPMKQLEKAGVDLSQPETVQAVIDHMDELVTRLEKEIDKL